MRLIDVDTFFNDFPEMRDYEYASQKYEVDAEPVRHWHWIRNDNSTYLCNECQTSIPNEQHLIEVRRWCMIYGVIKLISLVLLVIACVL